MPRCQHNKNHRFLRQILPSWTACWCSNKPGNKIVLMSLSNSLASQSKRTYSLCVWCSFRQAFWYRSLQSSSLFPDLLLLYLCITFQKLVCGIWYANNYSIIMKMNANHEKLLTVLHIWIWTRHSCPGNVRSHFEFCALVPVFIEYKWIWNWYWNKNYEFLLLHFFAHWQLK